MIRDTGRPMDEWSAMRRHSGGRVHVDREKSVVNNPAF